MTNITTTAPALAGGALNPQWLAGRGRLAQSIRLEEQGPAGSPALQSLFSLRRLPAF